ncbi:hypothetical protein BDW62DRAFT_117338 [Aspergillus aurantiobrunneus]
MSQKMPSWDSTTLITSQRYPVTVPNLSKAELQSLIEVLAADPPLDVPPYYGRNSSNQIQDAIRKIPPTLHKKSPIFSLPRAFIPAAALCTTHKGLNQYIINHIFRLIKREVEDQLGLIITWHPEYPETLPPRVTETVQCLRSLRGMWWEFDSSQNIPNEAVPPQQNKCEACMISRIITNPEYLQNLSAALQSRTRERCSYRAPPKLFRVVQEAFNYRYGESLSDVSFTLSRGLKQARKDAACHKRLHAHGCNRNNCVPRHQRKTTPTEVLSENRYLNPGSRRQPSSQTLFFCMLQETTPPIESPNTPRQEKDDKDDEIQDQLLNDILDAYASAPRGQNASGNHSTNISPRQLSPAEQSEWEDDWDTRTIAIDQHGPNVDQLIDHIGNLLVDKEDLVQHEPNPFPKTTTVSPPSSLPYGRRPFRA